MDVDSKADYSQSIIDDYIDIMIMHGHASDEAAGYRRMYDSNPYVTEAFETVADLYDLMQRVDSVVQR